MAAKRKREQDEDKPKAEKKPKNASNQWRCACEECSALNEADSALCVTCGHPRVLATSAHDKATCADCAQVKFKMNNSKHAIATKEEDESTDADEENVPMLTTVTATVPEPVKQVAVPVPKPVIKGAVSDPVKKGKACGRAIRKKCCSGLILAMKQKSEQEGERKDAYVDLAEFLGYVDFPLQQCGRTIHLLSLWLKTHKALPKGQYIIDGETKEEALVKPEWLPGIVKCLEKNYMNKWKKFGSHDSKCIERELKDFMK